MRISTRVVLFALVLVAHRSTGLAALDKAWLESYEKAGEQAIENSLDTNPPEDLTDSQRDEVKILAAATLVKLGRTLAAQQIYMDVASRAIGTSQGALALKQLEALALTVEIDESAIEDFAFEYDGTVETATARSMLAWYRARALMRRGFVDWATRELGQVAVDSAWHSERLYDRAVSALADGREDEAEAIFSELAKKAVIRATTKQFSELNRARLIFEKGDYQASLEAVRGLDLPIRERARALHEMAWSRYYMREYGKALGILQVLDSGYYADLKTPEADLLRMVIERDLCRYDLVKQSTTAFRDKYKKTYKQIESRLPLESDDRLKQMALQSRSLQKRATLVHRLRVELRALTDEDIRVSPGLGVWLRRQLATRERQLQSEVDRLLGKELERVANQFVDLRDQVTFLEYESSIRPLTAAPSDTIDYLPTGASRTKFEKLHWPVTNESWWDELDSYEVMLRGRCQTPLPNGLGVVPAPRRPPPPPPPPETDDEDDE
ncbi:MAG: hypothetical protein JNJ49_00280 [Bdellovibrionaceae bacterium]|nr:hypothetical protein [Pseudobdellovibrionaceae bacterium]